MGQSQTPVMVVMEIRIEPVCGVSELMVQDISVPLTRVKNGVNDQGYMGILVNDSLAWI